MCPRNSKRVIDALIGKKISDVEEVARMLAIQRRNQLASVEIGKRNEPHLSEAQGVFDRLSHAAPVGGKYAATQDGGYLDLDLGASGAHQQLGNRALKFRLRDLSAADTSAYSGRDAFHRRVDGREGFRTRFDREIRELPPALKC